MANFLLLVDRDPQRRLYVMERARARVAPLDDLTIDHAEAGDCSVLWAANRSAPITQHVDPGGLTVCFGEPRGDDSDTPLTAADLARIWWNEHATATFDGYFAGVSWHPTRGLIAGTDILGTFPVYHWRCADTLLVASSIEMMHAHPQFTASIDFEGLAGILLTQGIVAGRTMLQGVRRLLPGRSLRYVPGGDVREPIAFALEPDDRYFDIPVRKQLDLLFDVPDAATNRPINPQLNHGMLLSGGMDSRMIAGCAHRHGVMANSLSLGDVDDLEVQFARQVAAELRWPHRHTEVVSAQRLPVAVLRCMRYEMLAGGMDSPNGWEMRKDIESLGQRTLSGLLLDASIGGSHIAWGYDELTGRISQGRFRDMLLRYGLPANDVRELLRQHDGGAMVDHVIAQLDATLRSYPGADGHKLMCFDLHHRQRLHVGAWLWQLSFAAWPVCPSLDRALVRTCLSIPPNVLMNRYAQEQILIRHLPNLAEIPLDRNSDNTAPLITPFRAQLRHRLARRLRPLSRWIAPSRRVARVAGAVSMTSTTTLGGLCAVLPSPIVARWVTSLIGRQSTVYCPHRTKRSTPTTSSPAVQDAECCWP